MAKRKNRPRDNYGPDVGEFRAYYLFRYMHIAAECGKSMKLHKYALKINIDCILQG